MEVIMENKFVRNCPNCGKEIEYKSKSGIKHAIKNNILCINCRYPDLTGKTINGWKVIKFAGKKYIPSSGYFSSLYDVECPNCHEIFRKKPNEIKNFCLSCKLRPKGQVGLDILFYNYNKNAKHKNREFDLSLEDFKKLTSSNCYYCNSIPSQIMKIKEVKSTWGHYFYNGIDRIDNEIGYTKTNVVSCCKFCNYGKWNYHSDEFKKYIINIYRNALINTIPFLNNKYILPNTTKRFSVPYNYNEQEKILDKFQYKTSLNLEGIINGWKVINYFGTVKRKNFWEIECVNCGARVFRGHEFAKSYCRYCTLFPKGQTGLNKLFGHHKLCSKQRNLEFNLTLDEFEKITSSNCYYCNSTPSQVCKHENKITTWGHYKYNGIDRMDNNVGYLLGNTVPCCKICNRAKTDFSFDEFKSYILNICKNAKNHTIPFMNEPYSLNGSKMGFIF